MRLIATEEAFAPREYFDAYLKLAETLDTAETRYLKMYYKGPLVDRLSDMDVRLAEMDRQSAPDPLRGPGRGGPAGTRARRARGEAHHDRAEARRRHH